MNEEMISALVEFISKDFTVRQLAHMGLPGYPTTKVAWYKRLYKAGVRRQPRKDKSGCRFSFFDMPSSWQRNILNFFVCQYRRPKEAIHLTSKEYDAILFSAAAKDLQFARFWNQREIQRAEIHKKILRLLEL